MRRGGNVSVQPPRARRPALVPGGLGAALLLAVCVISLPQASPTAPAQAGPAGLDDAAGAASEPSTDVQSPVDPWNADCSVVDCIALTFDDGPSPGSTDLILDTLSRSGTPATFFMIGQNAADEPALAARVVAEGHQVGNHSQSHPDLTTLPPQSQRHELTTAAESIAGATGEQPRIVRPPYAALDEQVRASMSDLGLEIVMWSVDTRDWSHRDAQQTVAVVQDQAAPGGIVLMHDNQPSTAEALPEVISWLHDQGYVLVTVDRLLGTG